MIIEAEGMEEKLNSEGNLALKLGKGNRINHKNAGRNPGDNNLHPVLRSVISAAAQLDTAKNAALTFGVSPGHAHNLKHGRTVPNGEIKADILEGKKEVIDDVRSRAIDILLKSLKITGDKLEVIANKTDDTTKITSISQVAKDMALIVEKTAPQKDEGQKGPQVVILTVPQASLAEYGQPIEIGAKHED